MSSYELAARAAQDRRNIDLLTQSRYLTGSTTSQVIPITVDIKTSASLSDIRKLEISALEIEAARIAIKSAASLAEIKEGDHLGGGLELIPALLMTLAITDHETVSYTIEHAHTSIGYYAVLAALGFLEADDVIRGFRRGLDIPGHVAWTPGGTELNGGRLGVMIPVAVGQALGKKALQGADAWVITHCGDAGWISGQALNGFNGAAFHGAPITFVMHRNGIQLSGAVKNVMEIDPRPIIESLGIHILEINSLHDIDELHGAYAAAYDNAHNGRASMIYPKGYTQRAGAKTTVRSFGEQYGIIAETLMFAESHDVDPDTEVWIPGSLMSYRDVIPMLECLFLVNDLPGGAGHHDGNMIGRNLPEILANPMLTLSVEQQETLQALHARPKQGIRTEARPRIGSPNLPLPDTVVGAVDLPGPGKAVSVRAGTEAAYAAIAQTFTENMFVVGCDLDPSTKLAKARSFLAQDHQFEMGIEEQAAALMANGLATASRNPQLTVFSTFAAFFEGIAREGMELWRYQRNLNGKNEGLNVVFHWSHVGACTGRDHFSGWSLDWITMALGYLPYLRRFYTPADARAGFLAVRDAAAYYGAHIIGVPRDTLPILVKPDGSPLYGVADAWEPLSKLCVYPEARKAVLAIGAPAFLAADAARSLNESDVSVDVYVVNGLPLDDGDIQRLCRLYPDGIVTIEDGIIGDRETGLRGFAGLVAGSTYGTSTPLDHIGIVDPRIAPSEGHHELWEHFGITVAALIDALERLKPVA